MLQHKPTTRSRRVSWKADFHFLPVFSRKFLTGYAVAGLFLKRAAGENSERKFFPRDARRKQEMHTFCRKRSCIHTYNHISTCLGNSLNGCEDSVLKWDFWIIIMRILPYSHLLVLVSYRSDAFEVLEHQVLVAVLWAYINPKRAA